MRHFVKSVSPEDFENWKASAGSSAKYKNIPPGIKKGLRESLVKEQSNLCCYCGISLSEKNIHIEHFRPQKHFPKQDLKYENLHASCMGKLYIPSDVDELDFCGHAKGDWFNEELLVSPLDPNCESYFIFDFDGGISENHNAAAAETIARLQLGTYLLNTQRSAAIEGILDTIDISNTSEIEECISFLETPDQDGNLTIFSFIIVGLLRTLI